jgi:hemerythrin-like domain-containing protein
VRDYLVGELPLHTQDEEQDLFPVLARRCPSSDDIDAVFRLLRREHDCDRTLVDELVAALDALIDGQALPDPAAFIANARAVSETQRRHLAWENTVILPRARRHLNAEDLAALTQAMAARRNA